MRKLNNTAIPRDWLVAEYLFNGNLNDTSWNNYHWTASNISWMKADKWYVKERAYWNWNWYWTHPNTINWDSDFTLEFYFNADDITDWNGKWQYIWNGYWTRDVTLALIDSWDLQFWFYNWASYVVKVPTVDLVDWKTYHVICERIKSTWMRIYLNNELKDSNTYTWNWWNISISNNFFRHGSVSWHELIWYIWTCRQYNRILSKSEKQALYIDYLRKLWPTNLLPSPNTKVRDWLVWEWNLDNNALDTSWNWNDWTPTNVTYNPVWGWGVGSFNGSSSYIDLPNWILWWNTVSISVWAKYSSVSNGYDWKIVDLRNSDWHSVLIRANVKNNVDKFGFYTNFWTDVQSSSTPLDNEYHHFVLIVKNWDISFYNNNELVDSQSWTWTDSWNNEDWKIWQERNDWVNRHFWWQIWLTRIYNRALSQQEINQLHQEWLKYINWNKYSLPSLEQGKVLEISKPQSWWVYYDQSWNWNNWTATNVTDSTVWLNNAMSFNGSSNISIPYATDIAWSDNMTIAISIKPQSTSYQMIYVKTRDSASNTYSLGFWTDWWKIDFSIRDSTESYPAPWLMSTNTVFWIWKWLRVVWRVTNKKVEIFVNWKLQSTYNYSNAWLWDTVTNPINWTNNTEWGVLWKNGVPWYPFYFTWDMKWFKYYNRSLSDTEIQQDFHSTYIN